MLRLEKRVSSKTRKNSEGKEYKITYFVLVDSEGRAVLVKPCYNDDYKIFEYLAKEGK